MHHAGAARNKFRVAVKKHIQLRKPADLAELVSSLQFAHPALAHHDPGKAARILMQQMARQEEEDMQAAAGIAPLGLSVLRQVHVLARKQVAQAVGSVELAKAKAAAAEEAMACTQRQATFDGSQVAGSLHFYTPEQIHARKSLRQHKRIEELLCFWWHASSKHDDANNDEKLNKEEYERLYNRLLKAFADDDDSENDLTHEQARVAFDEDWEKDSGGDGAIDEEEFKDAIFELADHWCEGVDAIEYIEYLEMMYNRVFRDLIMCHQQEAGVYSATILNAMSSEEERQRFLHLTKEEREKWFRRHGGHHDEEGKDPRAAKDRWRHAQRSATKHTQGFSYEQWRNRAGSRQQDEFAHGFGSNTTRFAVEDTPSSAEHYLGDGEGSKQDEHVHGFGSNITRFAAEDTQSSAEHYLGDGEGSKDSAHHGSSAGRFSHGSSGTNGDGAGWERDQRVSDTAHHSTFGHTPTLGYSPTGQYVKSRNGERDQCVSDAAHHSTFGHDSSGTNGDGAGWERDQRVSDAAHHSTFGHTPTLGYSPTGQYVKSRNAPAGNRLGGAVATRYTFGPMTGLPRPDWEHAGSSQTDQAEQTASDEMEVQRQLQLLDDQPHLKLLVRQQAEDQRQALPHLPLPEHRNRNRKADAFFEQNAVAAVFEPFASASSTSSSNYGAVEALTVLAMPASQRQAFAAMTATERLVFLALPVMKRAEFLDLPPTARADALGRLEGGTATKAAASFDTTRPALSRLYSASAEQIRAFNWAGGGGNAAHGVEPFQPRRLPPPPPSAFAFFRMRLQPVVSAACPGENAATVSDRVRDAWRQAGSPSEGSKAREIWQSCNGVTPDIFDLREACTREAQARRGRYDRYVALAAQPLQLRETCAPLDGHAEPAPMTHPIPLFERLELAVDLARATAVATSVSQCPGERPAAATSAAASAAVAMASPLWRVKTQKRPQTVSGGRRQSPEHRSLHTAVSRLGSLRGYG